MQRKCSNLVLGYVHVAVKRIIPQSSGSSQAEYHMPEQPGNSQMDRDGASVDSCNNLYMRCNQGLTDTRRI